MGPPPLAGIKVLEFAGLAPGPFAGMLLADAGADVLRIDRPPQPGSPHNASSATDGLARRKASVAVDLKTARGVALVRRLAAAADVLIDPFRPGVLERLGLGPDELLRPTPDGNPRLIYARLSGFRRDGLYRDMAGHDINYLAVSGALAMLGRADEKPTPPINLLADFAGGGLMMVVAVLLALVARQGQGQGRGRGQVVEANMVDGVAYLASYPRFNRKTPMGDQPRGHNMLDSGSPFYDTYETAPSSASSAPPYMAIGPLEPQFFRVLCDKLGLDHAFWAENRYDRAHWPALRAALTAAFRRHTRAHWERVFAGSDACCTPVLSYDEMEEKNKEKDSQDSQLRAPFALHGTPLLAVSPPSPPPTPAGSVFEVPPSEAEARRGQGPGVPGGGFDGHFLQPGEGGDAALQRWLGWTRGVDYDELDGAFVLQDKKAKL